MSRLCKQSFSDVSFIQERVFNATRDDHPQVIRSKVKKRSERKCSAATADHIPFAFYP